MQRNIFKYACVNAVATTLYIGLVASVMFYGKHVVQGPDTVFMPMAMLMLFVFSAAVTSGLVLGRPIMWYLDGKKKEAIHLLVSTLSIFFVLLISAVLLIIKK